MKIERGNICLIVLLGTAAGVLCAALANPIQGAVIPWGQRESMSPGMTRGGSQTGGQPASYVYFIGCSGAYVKIDTATQRIVTQSTVWASPLVASVTPDQLGAFDACLIGSVQHSPGSAVIYAAIPKEARERLDTARHYWVVALQLPDFKLLSKIGPLDEEPMLLLNPGGTNLLVQGTTGRLYNVPDLEPIGGSKSVTGVQGEMHWTAAGRIVDRNRVLDDSGKLLQTVSGDAVVPDSFRLKWQRRRPDGTSTLYVPFADSTGDRMLFVGGADTSGTGSALGSGLMTYDVGTERVISTIDTPYRAAGAIPTLLETPTVHLVPGADRAVLEEYDWRWLEEGRERQFRRFKTGRIAIYDVKSGSLLRTVQLDPPPGFLARVIGFSPDGSLMYYGSTDHIYAVDLTGAKEPVTLPKVRGVRPNEGFPPLAVIFANQ